MNKSDIITRMDGVVFIDLNVNSDQRGWLVELFRSDHLSDKDIPAMGYASQTNPGMTRGPHEHRSQSDLFCFIGPGVFKLTLRSGAFEESHFVGEKKPVAVLVPPGIIHSYTNVSEYPGMVFNFPNRLYGGPGRCYAVDEIRHEDRPVLDTFFV